MTIRHRLLALTVVVLWGLNFIAIHAGLQHFPPFFFAGIRFAVMAIPVILFVPRPQVPLRWFVMYGIGFGTIQFAFLFLAMHIGMPTGLASLVLQSSAPFTVLLGVLLLGERMTVRQVAGLGVALIGVVIIGIDRASSGAGVVVVGIILTMVGGLGWAFGNIGNRLAMTEASRAGTLTPATPLHMALWMSVIPPLPLLALSAAIEGPSAGIHSLETLGTRSGLIAIAGLVYVIVLGTVAGSGLWTLLMGKYPASQVAPFSLLVPVVGISAAWLLLNETPSPLEVVGAVIVIVGCLAGMRRSAPSPVTSESGTGESGPADCGPGDSMPANRQVTT